MLLMMMSTFSVTLDCFIHTLLLFFGWKSGAESDCLFMVNTVQFSDLKSINDDAAVP